jgi:hypothetical protein
VEETLVDTSRAPISPRQLGPSVISCARVLTFQS